MVSYYTNASSTNDATWGYWTDQRPTSDKYSKLGQLDAIWTSWTNCIFDNTSSGITGCLRIFSSEDAKGRATRSATPPGGTSVMVSGNTWYYWTVGPQVEVEPTPEQRAEWARQAEETKKREAVIAENKRIARQRARELLDKSLSEMQRESLDKHGYFTMTTRSGREYQVKIGKAHNVIMTKGELPAKSKARSCSLLGKKEFRTMCFQPQDDHLLPEEDVMLAQKLALETMEDEVHQIANWS